jgi:hypothetical protein
VATSSRYARHEAGREWQAADSRPVEPPQASWRYLLRRLTLVTITYILVGMIDATLKWNGRIIRVGSS